MRKENEKQNRGLFSPSNSLSISLCVCLRRFIIFQRDQGKDMGARTLSPDSVSYHAEKKGKRVLHLIRLVRCETSPNLCDLAPPTTATTSYLV